MNKKALILYLILSALLISCSNISEDERLIYVKPASVSRNILIEDFTGQRCVNCPLASEEIENLKKQYEEGTIVAVSIHSGPLGFYTNSRFTGLATATGDEYFTHWGLDYQPVGMIDRSEPMAYTSWATSIREHLQQSAPVSIEIENSLPENGSDLDIQIDVLGIEGNITGKLQIWIVEDQITAFQMMPDGTRNDNYVHRHVFRSAVNGNWGEDISLTEGKTTVRNFRIHIPEEWNTEQLYIVAFVYNDKGVLQVKEERIKTQNDEE